MISTAFAQTATTGGMEGALFSYFPLLLVFVVFYFLILRPQLKRGKEHRNMLETLKRGDTIVTAGGLHAEIAKVNDDTVDIMFGDARVTLAKGSIAQVLIRETEKPEMKTPTKTPKTKSKAKTAKKKAA